MCENCGCSIQAENTEHLHIAQQLLAENDQIALHNQQHFNRLGIYTVNLMSAPGSGKTALLEAYINHCRSIDRLCVIEGDLDTENDAERIRNKGVTAFQITTGTACHLDAKMIHDLLHQHELPEIDLLFIENVGNLVCPASFALGQHLNIVLLGVTEGDDKPLKYPVMFRCADIVIINKIDLLPWLDDFSVERAVAALKQTGSRARVVLTSAKTGEGIAQLADILQQGMQ